MQITHEQARKLIQFSHDGVLQSAEKARLSAHLQNCADCREYANDLREVETILLPEMKRQWSTRPIPLSVPSLIESNDSRINPRTFLAMRRVALGLVLVALFFTAWNIMSFSPSISGPVPLVVPLVPTPAAQTAPSTDTTSTAEDCEMIIYSVQANDTLTDIASRFSVSEDEIMKVNGLTTTAVSSSMELLIPLCNFTPTGTIHPATFTRTGTPILRATTSTPEG